MLRRYLQQTVAPYWAILYGCGSFIIGIVLALLDLSSTMSVMTSLVVACVTLVVLLRKKTLLTVLMFIVAMHFLGIARGFEVAQQNAIFRSVFGVKVVGIGSVMEDPTINQKGETALKIKTQSLNSVPVTGTLWVRAITDEPIRRGDVIEISGTILPGFGSFSASMPRAKLEGIYARSDSDWALGLRDWFATRVSSVLPQNQADLGLGFLVGLKSTLEPEFADMLRMLGLTHIIVASGYNLTILVNGARRIGMKLSRFSAVFLSFGLMTLFIAIAGLSASLFRASIVAGLSVGAWYFGRTIRPLMVLLLSAVVTLWADPMAVMGDIGWYLSFLSFIGILIVAPLIQSYFFEDRKPNVVRSLCVETLSAQLMTLPLLMYVFGEYSLLSILANVLVVPAVPFGMLATALAGLLGPLVSFAALPAHLVLGYITRVVEWLSQFDYPLFDRRTPFYLTVLVFAMIFALTTYMHRKTRAIRIV